MFLISKRDIIKSIYYIHNRAYVLFVSSFLCDIFQWLGFPRTCMEPIHKLKAKTRFQLAYITYIYNFRWRPLVPH